MSLVNLKTLLVPAYKQKYAVGAFNIINLEFLESIVSAAVINDAPVIINIAEAHFACINLKLLCSAVKTLASSVDIPIALNLDHGQSFETVVCAIRNGFTSVMFDGSRLPFTENIKQTKKTVELCHSIDVSVEAELGIVGGSEDGKEIGYNDSSSYFTDPDMAVEFVKQTNVDALAVSIGNVHGLYKGDPNLDFIRLKKINDKLLIPLVLHGGTGITEDNFKTAINLGIAKVNYFTGIAVMTINTIKHRLSNEEEMYNDAPKMQKEVKLGITNIVSEQIKIFGSCNKRK